MFGKCFPSNISANPLSPNISPKTFPRPVGAHRPRPGLQSAPARPSRSLPGPNRLGRGLVINTVSALSQHCPRLPGNAPARPKQGSDKAPTRGVHHHRGCTTTRVCTTTGGAPPQGMHHHAGLHHRTTAGGFGPKTCFQTTLQKMFKSPNSENVICKHFH